jgi:hypothetical protein
VLLALGEDDEARGDLVAARANFEEARRTTAALIADAPRDPDIVFTHAQSEFWVGSLAWERKDLGAAEAAFQRYAALADRLVELAPRDPRSLKEVGYAAGNLCSLRYEQDRTEGLVDMCTRALASMEAAARLLPTDPKTLRDVANRHAWVADAYRKTGNIAGARAARTKEAAIIEGLLKDDPKNAKLERARIWSERALSRLEWEGGATSQSIARLAAAAADLERLVAQDPENRTLATTLTGMKKQLQMRSASSERITR